MVCPSGIEGDASLHVQFFSRQVRHFNKVQVYRDYTGLCPGACFMPMILFIPGACGD